MVGDLGDKILREHAATDRSSPLHTIHITNRKEHDTKRPLSIPKHRTTHVHIPTPTFVCPYRITPNIIVFIVHPPTFPTLKMPLAFSPPIITTALLT